MIHRSVMLWNRGMRSSLTISSSRRFCQTGPNNTLEVTPQIRQKNTVTAVALVSAVAGIYYVAFSKMREETDDLSTLITEKK